MGTGNYDVSNMYIMLGTDINSASAKVLQVTGAVVNPGWQGAASTGVDQSDIAVVQVGGGFPAGYSPATVFTDLSSLKKGENVILAGYGITNAKTKAGAGVLRKTEVTIADPNLGNTEIVFDQTNGHGACHGDSGGPAFINQGGKLLLLGLTNRSYPDSAPDDCEHQAVYTKIAAYSDFITQAEGTLAQ